MVPGRHPSSSATRLARVMAATRRGWVTQIVCPYFECGAFVLVVAFAAADVVGAADGWADFFKMELSERYAGICVDFPLPFG